MRTVFCKQTYFCTAFYKRLIHRSGPPSPTGEGYRCDAFYDYLNENKEVAEPYFGKLPLGTKPKAVSPPAGGAHAAGALPFVYSDKRKQKHRKRTGRPLDSAFRLVS